MRRDEVVDQPCLLLRQGPTSSCNILLGSNGTRDLVHQKFAMRSETYLDNAFGKCVYW